MATALERFAGPFAISFRARSRAISKPPTSRTTDSADDAFAQLAARKALVFKRGERSPEALSKTSPILLGEISPVAGWVIGRCDWFAERYFNEVKSRRELPLLGDGVGDVRYSFAQSK